MRLRLGKPDVRPDAPSHTRGIKQGNARGNYEQPGRAQAGRHVDGRARRPASTPRTASRSIRACRTCRPPRWRSRRERLPAPSWHSRRWVPRRWSTRPRPRSRFALKVDERERRADPLGAARRRSCRSPRAGAPTSARSASGCSSCSARPIAGARTLRTLLWTRHDAGRAAVQRQHAGGAAGALHATTSRSRRPRYLERAGATARCRSSSCSAARSSTRTRTGATAGRRASRGRARPSYSLPVSGLARDDGPPLPRLRLAAAVARELRPAARVPGARRAAELGRGGRARCWGRSSRGRASGRSPTPCSTRATSCGPTGARR